LKLYHHSIFDGQGNGDQGEMDHQERGDRKKGRRINVELTAGGGGKKSQQRRAKIGEKNKKLEEERLRLRLKEKSEHEKTASKRKEVPGTGANAEGVQDNRGAIHPSRLSRVSH